MAADNHLFLASRGLPGLGAWLDGHAPAGTVALVADAVAGLPDRDEIVATLAGPLRATGRAVEVVDLGDASALRQAGAIAVAGGDPFRLLGRLRATGTDRTVAALVATGLPYVGMSAGAAVAGPSLAPLVGPSPFVPSPGQALDGLGLAPSTVLAHHDHPGRAGAHLRRVRALGPARPSTPLGDDEVLVVDGDRSAVALGQADRRWRIATGADAAGVAQVFTAAARAAWASFLDPDRLAAFRSPEGHWATRIAESPATGSFSVIDQDGSITAFAATRPATDPDLDGSIGELALFYAHPRVWGTDAAARLHERARTALVTAGHDRAVLWTEDRNERALAFYRRRGWRRDGAVRERTWLEAPIREHRYRLDLLAEPAPSRLDPDRSGQQEPTTLGP